MGKGENTLVFTFSFIALTLQINSLNKRHNLNWSKLKAFAEDKMFVTEKIFCFLNGRKLSGKRRKGWSPVFIPFPTIFSKDFFLRVV